MDWLNLLEKVVWLIFGAFLGMSGTILMLIKAHPEIFKTPKQGN